MTWTKTRTVLTLGSIVLALGSGLLVKRAFFPSVSDSFFQLDSKKLGNIPSGLLVLRPTHFPNSSRKGIVFASSGHAMRVLGRNVPLEDIFPVAYRSRSSRMIFPTDMPKGNFDFLVTMPDKPEEQLQAIIKKELGYIARKETRDADVLLMKVETPDAPGLRASGDAENGGTAFKDGKLFFTHMRVDALAGFLEWNTKQTILDQTGLTSFYDYAINWDWRMMQRGRLNHDNLNKALGEFGLRLEPGSEPLEMLVVEKVK